MNLARRRPNLARSVRRSAAPVASLTHERRDRSDFDLTSPLVQPPDTTLATATFLLMAIGMVWVYSAGALEGALNFSSTGHFLAKQLLAAFIGIGIMIGASRMTLAQIDRWTKPLVAVTLLALVLVLIPGIGIKVSGARRWLGIGGINFQPSELARLTAILLTARYAARNPEEVLNWKGLLKAMAIPAIFGVLILAQPDFDTGLIMLGFAGLVLFVAGLPWRYVGAVLVSGAAATTALIVAEPYRVARVTSFLDPTRDPQGKGYQILQCWIGMGSGGFFGRGLGNSIQKLGFLPEAHTDFIFAILGEEGCFVLTTFVVALYGVIAWRGYRITSAQTIPYARYLGAGITAMVTIQALLNLMVVTGLAPTTGIPLPLVSYGGTSVVFITAALGILWGLSRRRDG